jgi:uncharacterized protein involved in tolerance to divalent cations
MATEKGRDKLELVTTTDKVAALIDYVNENNPTIYDYPVPDTIAIPVTTGNPKFLSWAKSSITKNAGGLKEDPDAKPSSSDDE